MEAVIELHEKHSDRTKRAKSRIKFLVERFGAEGFVARFEEAFARSRAAHAARPLPPQAWREPTPGVAPGPGAPRAPLAQRQPGLVSVPVQVTLGHLSSFTLRGLASLMRKQGLDDIRSTQDQNLVLRGVRAADVAIVVAKLGALGLGLPRPGDNVVACPGTSTCRLGITASQPLGARLAGIAGDLALARVRLPQRLRATGDRRHRHLRRGPAAARPPRPALPDVPRRRRHRRRTARAQGAERAGRARRSRDRARRRDLARVGAGGRALRRLGASRRPTTTSSALLADIVEVKAEDLESVLRDVDGETDFKVAQLGGGECAGVSQVFIGAAFYAAAHERRYRDAFAAQGRHDRRGRLRERDAAAHRRRA